MSDKHHVTGNHNITGEVKAGGHVIHGDNNTVHGNNKLIDFLIKNHQDIFGAIAVILLLLLNPSAETHAKHIKDGVFKDYSLYKNIFYDNYWIYSCTYLIEEDQIIPLSYGFLGMIFKSDDYSYNQFQISQNKIKTPHTLSSTSDFCGLNKDNYTNSVSE